jgi:hypothetical protein
MDNRSNALLEILVIIILLLVTTFIAGCAGNGRSFLLADNTSNPVNTVIPSSIPSIIIFTVTPVPDMVYPVANTSPIEHIITPNSSLEENYSESEYPRIIDNGNDTVNIIIYLKSASGQMVQVVYENEQFTYGIIPTRASENATPGPMVVRGMEVADITNFLKVQIAPLPDGTGNVSIYASTPLGNYRFNGTILGPLEIQPTLYDIGFAYPVENNQIQIAPGYYLDLAPVRARNQTFYVIAKTVYPE